MLSSESGRQRPLLKWVVDGGWLLEHSTQGHTQPRPDLRDEEGSGEVVGGVAHAGVVVVGRQGVHLDVLT